MNTVAWIICLYIALDRLATVAMCGRRPPYKIEITPSFAVISLITGSLLIWGVVSLGT